MAHENKIYLYIYRYIDRQYHGIYFLPLKNENDF